MSASLTKQIDTLSSLVEALKSQKTPKEKLDIFDAYPPVVDFFKNGSSFKKNISAFPVDVQIVIKAIAAIGQAERLFSTFQAKKFPQKKWEKLIEMLLQIEKFYEEVGGIVGYHCTTLQLLKSESRSSTQEKTSYYAPEGVDISQETLEVRRAILWGIEHLGQMSEIYPVGGAADRLRLEDERTGTPLPAAKLLFCGKTLLEGLICDLQAREYLHYKLFGNQLSTPIAMMTSYEKNNHYEILSICAEKNWFGRPKNSFYFFPQPSVPAMNKQGQWCLQGPLQPLLKPGGHGMIWKMARDSGALRWIHSKKRKKALVRQINNPIASVDYGLLAFSGLGCAQDKIFGFASCPRKVKSTEGVNVLIERKREENYEYVLTNIEYCDFKKYRIVDEPMRAGSSFSKFSSNTNLLFVDLNAIVTALEKVPIPGMLVNPKKSKYFTSTGEVVEEEVVRLESTMQNIADFFVEAFPSPLEKGERGELATFLTYNEREKTISTVKREYTVGSSLIETPEGCFLDLLHNAYDLLTNYCRMHVPKVNEELSYFVHGPSFIFHYHPALGPLYSIIAQKIRGGHFMQGAEMQLEIAELDIEELELQGSLKIKAESLMGHLERETLKYSEKTGKCVLKKVKIQNEGIDRENTNTFWKNDIIRKECCEILIEGNGEFFAENVTLKGDLRIRVKNGKRVVAVEDAQGNINLLEEPLQNPSWFWKYEVGKGARIKIKKQRT